MFCLRRFAFWLVPVLTNMLHLCHSGLMCGPSPTWVFCRCSPTWGKEKSPKSLQSSASCAGCTRHLTCQNSNSGQSSLLAFESLGPIPFEDIRRKRIKPMALYTLVVICSNKAPLERCMLISHKKPCSVIVFLEAGYSTEIMQWWSLSQRNWPRTTLTKSLLLKSYA